MLWFEFERFWVYEGFSRGDDFFLNGQCSRFTEKALQFFQSQRVNESSSHSGTIHLDIDTLSFSRGIEFDHERHIFPLRYPTSAYNRQIQQRHVSMNGQSGIGIALSTRSASTRRIIRNLKLND